MPKKRPKRTLCSAAVIFPRQVPSTVPVFCHWVIGFFYTHHLHLMASKRDDLPTWECEGHGASWRHYRKMEVNLAHDQLARFLTTLIVRTVTKPLNGDAKSLREVD